MKDRTFLSFSKKLTKHKYLEIELTTNSYWNYFNLFIKMDRHTDHAGFFYNIEIFGLNYIFQIFDNRHWDDDNNCWMKYTD
jgi:hypothetical protein